ncbi:MAG: U32 family peptidase [Clostridiales bacterium]|nr:U32 family peptidase [Clostridiales bacterium]
MAKPELLAPAGNRERFETAIRYGADAVYLGLPAFSLRNLADNFSLDTLPETVKYAHDRNVKVYVTVNSFVRDANLPELGSTLSALGESGADALIVNDPAVIRMAGRLIPDMPLHLSTQANTLNSEAASFWYDQGVSRIVLARELTLEEIKLIRSRIPKELELEVFVHGAMCVSYSGRCLLSNYIDGRDSNRGECVQPCRWNYEVRDKKVFSADIREHGKNGEYFTVEDDGKGSFILNSRDMCLAPYLKEIEEAGVSCIKIEGRMKSILYVATAVNAYRMALDGAPTELVMNELIKLSHRPYTTGFAFRESEKCRGGTFGKERSLNILYGENPQELMEYSSGGYVSESRILAVVTDWDEEKRAARIEQRNNFKVGDTLNILAPSDVSRSFTVTGIINEAGESVPSAPHPKEKLTISCPERVSPGDILRSL